MALTPIEQGHLRTATAALEALAAANQPAVTNPAQEPERRFNGALHFFTGVLTFSAALVVGIVATLPDLAKGNGAVRAMLGGMLFWSAVVIILSAFFAAIIQYWKFAAAAELVGERLRTARGFMILVVVFGVPVALYAMRGAAAITLGVPDLPGWLGILHAFGPT